MTLGLDWVVIDTEHGHLDYKEVVEHIRATRNTTTTPLVRIPEMSPGSSSGCSTWAPTASSSRRSTRPTRWRRPSAMPSIRPQGIRGVGGDRATLWGLGLQSQTAIANRETMVIPLIETVAGGRNLAAILDVPGVDAIFLGPADYSASAGYLGQWEGPGVAEAILGFKDAGPCPRPRLRDHGDRHRGCADEERTGVPDDRPGGGHGAADPVA